MSTRTTGALAIAFPVSTPAQLAASIGLCNELAQVSQINGMGELGQIVTSLLTALDALAESGTPTLGTSGSAGTTTCTYMLVPVYPAQYPQGNANQPSGLFLEEYAWPPPWGRHVGAVSPPPALAFWLGCPETVGITLGGTFHAGDQLTATINGTAVEYTVVSGDTNLAGAATSFAAAIAAASISGISATASTDVVTITGPVNTLTVGVAGTGHTITLTAGAITQAPHVGDVIAVTVNGGSAIDYTVVSGDTSLSILAGHVAGAITAAGQSGVTAIANGNVVTVNGAYTLSTAISGSGSTTQVLGLENPYYSQPGVNDYALRARGLPGPEATIATANENLSTSNKVSITLPAHPTSNVTGFAWDVVKVMATPTGFSPIGAVALAAAPGAVVYDDGHTLVPYTFRAHTDVGYDSVVGVIYAPLVWPVSGD
jgi:hypothetical protein